MALSLTEAQQRVARGAQVLDRLRPGWYREIRPERLEMRTSCHCIIGQLTNGNWTDLADMVPLLYVEGAAEGHADGGFIKYDAKPMDVYSVLQQVWLDLIRQRLAADAEAPIVTWTHRAKEPTSA
jgi:hypothetical protein